MARPGLEPGTPRFSVVRANLPNWAEIPGKPQVRWSVAKRANSCDLRSFALRLGTEVGAGTQCSQASAPNPRQLSGVAGHRMSATRWLCQPPPAGPARLPNSRASDLHRPGPQPGDPAVRSVLCVHIVRCVHVSGRNGRKGRSGWCHGCCPSPDVSARACPQGRLSAARCDLAAPRALLPLMTTPAA